MLANFISKPFTSLFSKNIKIPEGNSIVVIGLGRFGSSVSESLMRLGHDVMGIDNDANRVQKWATKLTHAVEADSTNIEVLRHLGVVDFHHAIVAIGTDMGASLMTIMALVELNIKDIWVKAMTAQHGHIANRIGAHHVVFPEADMGERVAHLITGKMIDFIEFDDGFALAKIRAPVSSHNLSLLHSAVREKYGVTVVGVKRANKEFEHATPETVVLPGDILIVSGATKKIELYASGQAIEVSETKPKTE